MNFLAHIHLSFPQAELMLGNFLADYLRIDEIRQLPEGIREGVEIHHEIDAFTDRHLQVKSAKRRLYPWHGKYAPIVIDVFYDHLLIQNWQKIEKRPIETFYEGAYRLLGGEAHKVEGRARDFVDRLLEYRWLHQYGSMEGLQRVFLRIEQRTKFPSRLDSAVARLQEDYGLYESEFMEFYPQLFEHIQGLIRQINLRNSG